MRNKKIQSHHEDIKRTKTLIQNRLQEREGERPRILPKIIKILCTKIYIKKMRISIVSIKN